MSPLLSYADFMVAAVSGLLPRTGVQALCAAIRIEWDDLNAETERPPVGGWLYLACYAPNNYVQVWAAFSRAPGALPRLDWKLQCSHDSAWREDGIRDVLRRCDRALRERASEKFKKPVSGLHLYTHVDDVRLRDATEVLGAERRPSVIDPLKEF